MGKTSGTDGGLSNQTDANNMARATGANAPGNGDTSTGNAKTAGELDAGGKAAAQTKDPAPNNEGRVAADQTLGNKAPAPSVPGETLTNQVNLSGDAADAVNERLNKLSEKNQEGVDKLNEAEEKKYAAIDKDAPVTTLAGTPLGREDNGNTPIVGKDGSKSWHPPGVAGAEK